MLYVALITQNALICHLLTVELCKTIDSVH